MPPTFHRYKAGRVAPAPEQPQLSLREEVAIYKAKVRAAKAARIAATPPPKPAGIIKPKTRAKKRNERTHRWWTEIKTYFKALGHDFTSGFRRHAYMCMGYMCCMTTDVRSFVDEEFPTQSIPVV